MIVARFETNAWETCQLDFEFLNSCSNPSAPTTQATCLVFQVTCFSPSGPRLRFSVFPRFFRNFLMLLRFIDSALLREWTVQSLIVDQTHLVLVSGKLVLQKSPKSLDCSNQIKLVFHLSSLA